MPRTALVEERCEVEAADLGGQLLEAVLGHADAARAVAPPQLAHDVVERRAARGVEAQLEIERERDHRALRVVADRSCSGGCGSGR